MAGVCAGSLMLAGCGRRSTTDTSEQPSLLDSFYTDIAAIEETQGAEAVEVRLRAMVDDPAFNEIRATVFQRLLETLCAQNRVADAQALYLERGGDDQALAEAGFPYMMSVSLSGDLEANAAWLERVIASRIPTALRVAVWQNRMALYAQAGSVVPVVDRLPELMAGDLAPSLPSVLQVALSQGMRISDLDGVASLLAAVEENATGNPALDKLVKTVKGELLVARVQLKEALDHYLSSAAVLGDVELGRGLKAILKAASEKGVPDVIPQVIDAAYQRGSEFPSARDGVAVWAVSAAAKGGDAQALLDTTRVAVEQGASVAKLYYGFARGYYAAIQTAAPEIQANLIALIQRMQQTPDLSEGLRSMMATALLDGYFLSNNLKGVLSVLDAGVPGYDEAWHLELRDKVFAHLALQEGRFDEAVAGFQKHIERVRAWKESITNPENGQKVIKEAVLGFNEKRVGDILSRMPGREADAKAAYTRSRQCYNEALAILEKDSPEYADAAKELAAVPSVD